MGGLGRTLRGASAGPKGRVRDLLGTVSVTITDTVTQASVSQTHTIDLVSVVGGNVAYLGFTGGTGGLTAVQDIVNWTFRSP